jgi:hypothetical protein
MCGKQVVKVSPYRGRPTLVHAQGVQTLGPPDLLASAPVGHQRPRLYDRLGGSVRSGRRLWLAIATASVSAVVLGGAVLLVTFATLFRESCGEDWRWVGLVAATGIAAMAAVVGLTLGGLSLHRHSGGPTATATRPAMPPVAGEPRWAVGLLTVTGLAWAVGVAAMWLPTGACP